MHIGSWSDCLLLGMRAKAACTIRRKDLTFGRVLLSVVPIIQSLLSATLHGGS